MGGHLGTGQMDSVVMARPEALESARGKLDVSELQAGVGSIIKSQVAQITQLLVGMSGPLGNSLSGVKSQEKCS